MADTDVDDWVAPPAPAAQPSAAPDDADDWVDPAAVASQREAKPSVMRQALNTALTASNPLQSPMVNPANAYQFARGVVGSTAGAPRMVIDALGIPGDIEQATVRKLSDYGLTDKNEGHFFPTTEDIEKTVPKWTMPASTSQVESLIPGQPSGPIQKGAQTAGELLSPLMWGRMIKGIGEVGDTISGALRGEPEAEAGTVIPAGNVAKPGVRESLWPGATERATTARLETVGDVTDPTDLGRRMMSDLRPEYQNLATQRQKLLDVSPIGEASDNSTIGDSLMSHLRPDYDKMYDARQAALERAAPSSAYRGASPDKVSALNSARAEIYNHPTFADLKTFEENPLGKQITATTGQYSDVPRLDPYNLPNKAFKSANSVSDLRTLVGNNEPAFAEYANGVVEKHAGDYAATSLQQATTGKDIGSAADAANNWMMRNRAWLNQVPQTKAAVQGYVKGLQQAQPYMESFENSPILKPLGGNMDFSSLPDKAFSSGDSVTSLRSMMGETPKAQPKTEAYAGEYAAQQLTPMTHTQNIQGAATSASKWLADPATQGWLKQVPETKAAVENYVQGLQYVAKVQKYAKALAKGTAWGTLGYGGLRTYNLIP